MLQLRPATTDGPATPDGSHPQRTPLESQIPFSSRATGLINLRKRPPICDGNVNRIHKDYVFPAPIIPCDDWRPPALLNNAAIAFPASGGRLASTQRRQETCRVWNFPRSSYHSVVTVQPPFDMPQESLAARSADRSRLLLLRLDGSVGHDRGCAPMGYDGPRSSSISGKRSDLTSSRTGRISDDRQPDAQANVVLAGPSDFLHNIPAHGTCVRDDRNGQGHCIDLRCIAGVACHRSRQGLQKVKANISRIVNGVLVVPHGMFELIHLNRFWRYQPSERSIIFQILELMWHWPAFLLLEVMEFTR